MNYGNRTQFQKYADKILAIFSDGRVRDHDLMYVAFYTVIGAYPEVVLDRIIEYTEHVKFERDRIKEDMEYRKYVQDTLF
jgi:outer membrane lipopolysaccharide assembly protein LptE/RlpB